MTSAYASVRVHLRVSWPRRGHRRLRRLIFPPLTSSRTAAPRQRTSARTARRGGSRRACLRTVMPIDLRALAPAPVASTRGTQSEDEGKRCHQDRAKPRPRRLHHRYQQRLAVAHMQFERDFHNVNRVPSRPSNERDQPDLGVKIVVIRRPVSTAIGPSSDSGTASITDSGAYQLSYWPASTRYTGGIARPNTDRVARQPPSPDTTSPSTHSRCRAAASWRRSVPSAPSTSRELSPLAGNAIIVNNG